MPAAILARNYMGSFLQFSDENADKVCNILDELKNYISDGVLPDEKGGSGDHEI